MEVKLIVPDGTSISAIEAEYSDIYKDAEIDGEVEYWIGKSEDDEEIGEWLTRDEAIRFCGFCDVYLEGIDGAYTCIEGDGQWAMSMLSRKDFGLAVGDNDKAEYKRESKIYHEGFRAGKKRLDQ